ncbi:hypothetical protein BaRGS_00028635, partial [Batillaria attramentaria]
MDTGWQGGHACISGGLIIIPTKVNMQMCDHGVFGMDHHGYLYRAGNDDGMVSI